MQIPEEQSALACNMITWLSHVAVFCVFPYFCNLMKTKFKDAMILQCRIVCCLSDSELMSEDPSCQMASPLVFEVPWWPNDGICTDPSEACPPKNIKTKMQNISFH